MDAIKVVFCSHNRIGRRRRRRRRRRDHVSAKVVIVIIIVIAIVIVIGPNFIIIVITVIVVIVIIKYEEISNVPDIKRFLMYLFIGKQGRIHGHQLRTGGQGRKCNCP